MREDLGRSRHLYELEFRLIIKRLFLNTMYLVSWFLLCAFLFVVHDQLFLLLLFLH